MAIIDLTRVLNTAKIYREDGYSDPEIAITEWCDVAGQGYRVARLSLGTQSGTHIDAPAHFCADGATLEQLDVAHLMGRYFHLGPADLATDAATTARLRHYDGEGILFVLSPQAAAVTAPLLEHLLTLPCPLWVVAGTLRIRDRSETHLNLRLAETGRYLVEDLDPAGAARVSASGTITALPLRLEGVSGAPCRVVAVCGS